MGHKARECTQPARNVNEIGVGQAAEISNVQVGGVWMIANVEAEQKRCEEKHNSPELADGDETDEKEWVTVVPKKSKRRVSTKWKSGNKVEELDKSAIAICPVELCSVKTEITIDSAAEESVCPEEWATSFGLKPVQRGKELRLVAANGGKIGHYGSRKIAFKPRDDQGLDRMMGLGFEVADVRKPLASVSRICEKGNIVQFGPCAVDNFIQSVATKEKVFMKKKGNSYVLEGDLCSTNPF